MTKGISGKGHKAFLDLAFCFVLGLTAGPAGAATYTVNTTNDTVDSSDGKCSLREAIQSANGAGNGNCGPDSPGDDTIDFNVSGTITLGSTLPNIVSASTAGKLTIDGTGQTITISGGGSVRVMVVDSGANLTLQNLTIANGASSGDGAGIYNGGTLTVTNSTFSGNTVIPPGAAGGGGIFNAGGTLTVTNSTFSGNSAQFHGGGIFNAGGTLTVTNSTFSGNSAYHGGGISNAATLTVTNSTFAGNSAVGGGGIFNYGTLNVTNSTFSGNSASLGGGISVYTGSSATLQNTIIANSPSGGDCTGTLSGSNINNLIESTGTNACGLLNGVNGNIVGQDPALGSLTGSPGYFPLNSGSPAIDAGDNTTCANPPVSNQSQNGVTRPQDSDGNGTPICDIGSFEAQGPPVDAVDDAATFLANTSQSYNVGTNDQYGTGSLPGSATFSLLQTGTNCPSANINSTTGEATFTVPSSGSCVVAYQVCVGAVCDTAELTITAWQRVEPIPTVDQRGLAALVLLLVCTGLYLVRRRVVVV
ncbi:hypothetical protein HRbin30_01179 [bacterium HR30]|nr:hypothetical protein HRbin30_01179 [bacterium HR30]